MQRVFGIQIDFEKNEILLKINRTIKNYKKGYVCVVDGNVLANCYTNSYYKEIINNALANTCDGSSISSLTNIIHNKKYKTYTGPEIFADLTKSKYSQLFLGNTPEIHSNLKNKFIDQKISTNGFYFETLPFLDVNQFDYINIANKINELNVEIIWVSLGAPKQEIFISKIYPLINKGVLIAIGAAFNLYLNSTSETKASRLLTKYKLGWLYRSYKEPRRIGKRALNYLFLLPKIVINEIIEVYFKKQPDETTNKKC